jgi:hypothetical protein
VPSPATMHAYQLLRAGLGRELSRRIFATRGGPGIAPRDHCILCFPSRVTPGMIGPAGTMVDALPDLPERKRVDSARREGDLRELFRAGLRRFMCVVIPTVFHPANLPSDNALLGWSQIRVRPRQTECLKPGRHPSPERAERALSRSNVVMWVGLPYRGVQPFDVPRTGTRGGSDIRVVLPGQQPQMAVDDSILLGQPGPVCPSERTRNE